jgi:uncharacterized damage-inducible protein DinB
MRTSMLVLILAAIGGGPALAQPAPAAGGATSQAVREDWGRAIRNLRESADQMPADGYAFKPVDTVRTFGQVIAHVAGVNYIYCGAAISDKTPRQEDAIEKGATTKDAIVKALGESIAYCDKAYAALTDATAGQQVDLPFNQGKGPGISLLLGNISHVNEHYGNLVTYFRIKGMVPPSSKQ